MGTHTDAKRIDVLTRQSLACSLRRAADGTVSEKEFREHLRLLLPTQEDRLSQLAHAESERFWELLRPRRIFLIPVERGEEKLMASRERLRILARAFEENWHPARAEREIAARRSEADLPAKEVHPRRL